MSDDVDVTFGMGDAARIDRSVMYTERVVIGNPTPPRRYYSPDAGGGGSGGGGTGGGGCSCCDCTQCLNMCTQNATDVIQTCSACTVAPKTFTANLGSVLGTQNFVYVSGCNWETANFTVYYVYPTGAGGATAGVYKGTFVEAGASSTLTITYVSGTDTLKLSTARQLSWKPDPDKSWSCICNMTMIPSVSPEKFPPNLFVPCEACVAPVDATAPSYADCTYLATNKLCVDSVTIGNIDFAASGGNTACGTASFTDASLASQTHDASGCCFSLKDAPYDTYAGYYKQFNCPPSATMFIGFAICINATTGAISVTITVTQQFALVTNYIFTATYTAVGPVTVGANTVTYVSSSGVATGGGGAITDASWPGTLTINASHCLFGDTHYDYGYGCGNGSGSCVGKCQVRSTAGASPTGFVWTFTGAVASTCVGAGCGCPTIDAITAIWGYPEANDPVEYVNVDCVSS